MDAWQRRDRPAAEAILHDEFVLVSSLHGETFSKAEWLEGAMGPIRCRSFTFDRIQVRQYGAVAIVICWYHQIAEARGKPWNGRFVMTDVWVKVGVAWQVVSRHATWLDAPQDG
jgi:hypothetical protein